MKMTCASKIHLDKTIIWVIRFLYVIRSLFVTTCSFAYLNLESSLFWTWCGFHSFIYYCDTLFLFVSLDTVPCLAHCHKRVWSCSPLMNTMFIKFILKTYPDVISNQTVSSGFIHLVYKQNFPKKTIFLAPWYAHVDVPPDIHI